MLTIMDEVKFAGLESIDPGTSNTDTTVFVDCRTASRILATVYRVAIGGATDYFDVLTLLQATSAAGANAKALGGGISAANLALGAAAAVGQVHQLEADVGQLDTENDFFFVGLRAAVAADNGTNTTTIIWNVDPHRKLRGMSTTRKEWANKDAA